jgi:hypothetical protein
VPFVDGSEAGWRRCAPCGGGADRSLLTGSDKTPENLEKQADFEVLAEPVTGRGPFPPDSRPVTRRGRCGHSRSPEVPCDPSTLPLSPPRPTSPASRARAWPASPTTTTTAASTAATPTGPVANACRPTSRPMRSTASSVGEGFALGCHLSRRLGRRTKAAFASRVNQKTGSPAAIDSKSFQDSGMLTRSTASSARRSVPCFPSNRSSKRSMR